MFSKFPRRNLQGSVQYPFSLVRYASLSSFYVTVEDDEGRQTRRELQIALKRFARNFPVMEPIPLNATATSVIVKLDSGSFFRAEVRHWLRDDFILVALIDEGKVVGVPKSNMFVPDEVLREIPVLARQCRLTGVLDRLHSDTEFLLAGQCLELRVGGVGPAGILLVSITSYGIDLGLLAVIKYDVADFEVEPERVVEGCSFMQYDLSSAVGVKKPAVARGLTDKGHLIVQISDFKPVKEIIGRSVLKPIEGDLSPGSACLGRIDETEQFMRAEVVSVLVQDGQYAEKVLVLLVDTHEFALMRRENLAELPDELKRIPLCCQEVLLRDMEDLSRQQKNLLSSLLEDVLIHITVSGAIGDRALVELDLPSDFKDLVGIPLRDLI